MPLYKKPVLIRSVAVPYETVWLPPSSHSVPSPTLPYIQKPNMKHIYHKISK